MDDIEAQAATNTTEQPQAGNTAATDTQAVSEAESISLDEAKKLRSEAASLRKRLRDAEAKEKERADAELSEQERTAKRLKEIETEREQLASTLRQERTQNAILSAAGKVGIDGNLAVKLLATHEFDYEDDGRPKAVESALRQLLKDYPQLSLTAPASATNPARTNATPQETAEQRRARIYGGGGNIFDPSTAASQGGGVVFTTKELKFKD